VRRRAKSSTAFALGDKQVRSLERLIDDYDSRVPPLRTFILPGGSQAASFLHLARTIARRAEREVVTLAAAEPVNPAILTYLNRLCDSLLRLRAIRTRSAPRDHGRRTPSVGVGDDPAETASAAHALVNVTIIAVNISSLYGADDHTVSRPPAFRATFFFFHWARCRAWPINGYNPNVCARTHSTARTTTRWSVSLDVPVSGGCTWSAT
jgi:hypothetical protein